MSTLMFPVLYGGTKGEKHLQTLFDCESNMSFIDPAYGNEICSQRLLGRVRNITSPNKTGSVEITHAITLDFFINGVLLSDEFFVSSKLEAPVVIGAPTIRKWRLQVNAETGQVEVNPKVAELKLI